MTLDRSNPDIPAVFTKITTFNGEIVSEQVITAITTDVTDQGQFSVRAYNVVSHDGIGNLLEQSTIEKPPVPKLDTSEDLQAKIDAVKSGNYREVVAEVEINPHSMDAVNGMDFQSDHPEKTLENTSQNKTDDANQKSADSNSASLDTQQVLDTRGGLPDTSAPTNTFTHYLDTQGSTLSTAQQDALAAQIDKLGIGTDKALSFYTLPGGGALIATADGDIVGEINRSSTGDLSLKATAIDASGNTVEVNNHINEQGSVQTQEQYNQAQLQSAAQAIGLFNGLMNLQQWDQLSDVGKLSALTGAYNAAHAAGAELPGDLKRC